MLGFLLPLLYLYGLPALGALAATWHLRRIKMNTAGGVAAFIAILLMFTLVSMEVRQSFQGEFLDGAA